MVPRTKGVAISFRSLVETSPILSIFRQTQQIQHSRHRLWMCVCARVLTPLHEDEIWMIQMKTFLAPVPLNVGPSAESRGLDSTLGAVPIRCCLGIISRSKMSCRKNCTRKATFQDVTLDTLILVVDDQPVLT